MNEDDIITVTTLRSKRRRTPNIRTDQIKGMTRSRKVGRIWGLYLLAKLTTLALKFCVYRNWTKNTSMKQDRGVSHTSAPSDDAIDEKTCKKK